MALNELFYENNKCEKNFLKILKKHTRTNVIFWPHLPPISTFFLYGAILSQKTFLLML